MPMPTPDYGLDLDRSLPQTVREQARQAIIAGIEEGLYINYGGLQPEGDLLLGGDIHVLSFTGDRVILS